MSSYLPPDVENAMIPGDTPEDHEIDRLYAENQRLREALGEVIRQYENVRRAERYPTDDSVSIRAARAALNGEDE